MEKKNTGLIVLVVVLSLLVVGLGGYIVYDKMLDKNINDSDNKGKNDNIIDKNDKDWTQNDDLMCFLTRLSKKR